LQVVIVGEPVEEVFQALCLYVVVASGTNEVSEVFYVEPVKSVGGKHIGLFEVGDCLFDVGPVSVLSKDSADDDFELGFARPPVLRAESSEEQVINIV